LIIALFWVITQQIVVISYRISTPEDGTYRLSWNSGK